MNTDSDYVRRSAGNALRDIGRLHATLIADELGSWDASDERVAQVRNLAERFLAR